MKRIAVLVAIFVATLAVPASATKPDPEHKVPLCHRTASATNPYVFIEVDEASLPAHLNNLPGHPPKDGRNDFIPSAWQIAHRTCAPEPPPPPGTYDVSASIMICGDPRAVVNLQNRGSSPEPFTTVFRRAGDGQRVSVTKTVAPDRGKTFMRWVLGRTMVKVYGAKGELLARTFVNRQSNTGPCQRVFTTN